MANLITILRFPLLLVIILLLSMASPLARLITVFLLVVLILMDSLDGMVARSRNEVSLMGSVLDIMADRSVELVLWICYAHLGLIPVAIPIIYVVRDTVVDALRSVYVGAGMAPLKAMRTNLGKFLVGSSPMRTSYAVSKLFSFAGLAFTHALAAYANRGAVGSNSVRLSSSIFNIISWLSVALCLARGLPVVVEALPFLSEQGEPG